MFDYIQLKRFNIKLSQLPKNSILINQPVPFYIQYKALVWTIAGIILFLTVALILVFLVQVRTRRAYQQSEARYQKLAEASFEGIIIHENGVIVDANHRMAELSGYSVKNLIGKNVMELVDPNVRDEVRKKLSEGYEEPFENKIIRRDGTSLWVDVSGKNLKIGGRKIRVVAVRDITLRKKQEEDMKKWFFFEQTVAIVLSHFVNITDIDNVINSSLRDLGRFTSTDCSYVFLFSPDQSEMSNSHEWCSPGMKTQIQNLQHILVDEFPWWSKKILNGEDIRLDTLNDLPLEAENEKNRLQAQNIRSLIALPIKTKEKTLGFVCFVRMKIAEAWQEDTIAILRLFAEVLGKALGKLKVQNRYKN